MVEQTDQRQKMKIPYTEDPLISHDGQEKISAFDPELEHEIVVPPVIRNSIILDELESKIREKLGYLAGRGALLHGFQGVGKTVLINKLAQDYKTKIVKVDKEMSSLQIRNAFNYARDLSENGQRIFLVIDEIDDFGQKEYAKYTGGLSKIICLMTELDGIKNETNVKNNLYVFATTNFLDNVDSRLLRPGRLEEIIEIPLPDIDTRRKIIEIHVRNRDKSLIKKYVELIVKKTNGFTPADIRGLFKHLSVAEIKGELNEKRVYEIIEEFEPSVKRGFEYFKDPEKRIEDVVGREIYFDFFENILSKKAEGSGNFVLYGPRGTGKTLTPEVLASYFGFNYISVKGSELQEGIVGEGTKKIKKVFDLASLSRPCIVLFDEIEGMISARGTISHRDDETSYFNSVLSRKKPGLYIFATINDPLKLNDTTLTRFEHRVYFDLPHLDEREKYLKKHLNKKLDFNNLASQMKDYSFRDMENIVQIVRRYDEKSRLNPNDSKIFSAILTTYTPENKACENHWEKIKRCIGDSTEIEKFICKLNEESLKK